MKIALLIGHGYRGDKGAYNKVTGTTEFDWNENLVKLINQKLPNSVIVYRDVSYSKLPSKINDLGVDLCVSFHCNAFNGSATGTETLYWNTSRKGKEIAAKLQEAVVSTLNLSDRGIKSKKAGDRGATILQKTRMPTVLLEPFFIDNISDLRVADAKKEELAKAIAECLKAL